MTGGSTPGPAFSIKPFGENAWIAEFLKCEGDVATALFANAVAKEIRNLSAHGKATTDVVAGIDSITLRFDPAALRPDDARATLENAIDATPFEQSTVDAKSIEIPVCYGGKHGPDFDDLCAQLGLTPQQFIDAHSARTYHVLTLGFAPGFAYLGPLDPALAAPRLDTPRPRVEAGAVGIAGPFTGVYPLASPGGWRIIGRTPACLFDPKAPSPFLFEPGAEVRFVPIEASAFSSYRRSAP